MVSRSKKVSLGVSPFFDPSPCTQLLGQGPPHHEPSPNLNSTQKESGSKFEVEKMGVVILCHLKPSLGHPGITLKIWVHL